MTRLERYVGYGLWGLVLFNSILSLAIADWHITADILSRVLIVVLWLLVTYTLAGFGLVAVYRHYLSHWGIWLVLIALFAVGALAIQGTLRLADARLSLLATLLFPMSGAALLGAITILLFWRDIGARLFAALSLVGIWGMVIAWRVEGNFIEALFQYLQTNRPAIVGWLNLLFCTTICLIPLAALSFVWHTAVLLWREIRSGEHLQQ